METIKLILENGMWDNVLENLVSHILTLVLASLAAHVSAVLFLTIFYLLEGPVREGERTAWFLSMLELAIRKGQDIQSFLHRLAEVGNGSHGMNFQKPGRLIHTGVAWDEAIARCPGFLRGSTVAILRAGLDLGNLPAAIGVCRHHEEDLRSRSRAFFQAFNPSLWFSFIIGTAVMIMLSIFVLPKFQELTVSLTGGKSLVSPHAQAWMLAALTVQGILGTFLTLHLVLPFFWRMIRDVYPGANLKTLHWLEWQIPWRRDRIVRDFTSILCAALDRGVSEKEAVELAAKASGSLSIQDLSQRTISHMSAGLSLTEALEKSMQEPELVWWMKNITMKPGDLGPLIRSWTSLLTQRAVCKEQAFAQVLSAVSILTCAFCTAVVAVSLFRPLILIVEEALLW